MRIRKRTIYIDSDLDKEFAKAAIDAELTFSTYYQTLLARFDKYIQINNAELDGRLSAEVGVIRKEIAKL